ncbi:putative nitrate transporter [Tripterygium wilfordii]|uniref:Putative nitrate transporter n=1 Tax=Tripterygium wilfordii TaxID=458696 RepID=A0A7J7BTS9_TRIWF|nr:putative nitrate transporter [Tripterygium wilfordii]
MVSVTLIVYVQSSVSWAIGLGIPAFLMFLSCAMFFLGTKIYVIVKPQGSPLTSVAQVVVSAAKKQKLKLPEDLLLNLFNHIPTNQSTPGFLTQISSSFSTRLRSLQMKTKSLRWFSC